MNIANPIYYVVFKYLMEAGKTPEEIALSIRKVIDEVFRWGKE